MSYLGRVRVARLTPPERNLLCLILNTFNHGGHPWATDANLHRFDIFYAAGRLHKAAGKLQHTYEEMRQTLLLKL